VRRANALVCLIAGHGFLLSSPGSAPAYHRVDDLPGKGAVRPCGDLEFKI